MCFLRLNRLVKICFLHFFPSAYPPFGRFDQSIWSSLLSPSPLSCWTRHPPSVVFTNLPKFLWIGLYHCYTLVSGPVTLELFSNSLHRPSLPTADKRRVLQQLSRWAESTPVRSEAYDYLKPAAGVSVQTYLPRDPVHVFSFYLLGWSLYLHFRLHTTSILMTDWSNRRGCIWATLFSWDKFGEALHCCHADSSVQAKQYYCGFLRYGWYVDPSWAWSQSLPHFANRVRCWSIRFWHSFKLLESKRNRKSTYQQLGCRLRVRSRCI